jgi:hypothetical protein
MTDRIVAPVKARVLTRLANELISSGNPWEGLGPRPCQRLSRVAKRRGDPAIGVGEGGARARALARRAGRPGVGGESPNLDRVHGVDVRFRS